MSLPPSDEKKKKTPSKDCQDRVTEHGESEDPGEASQREMWWGGAGRGGGVLRDGQGSKGPEYLE